jgi:hypothetical protein
MPNMPTQPIPALNETMALQQLQGPLREVVEQLKQVNLNLSAIQKILSKQ